MDIRTLKYFLCLAREQNMTAASKLLYISQSALSHQINELEDSLGTQLFTRKGRKMTLTEDGLRFQKQSEKIVELFNQLEDNFHRKDKSVLGEIKIGYDESIAISQIISAISSVHTDYPGIKFRFIQGTTNEIADKLRNGLIDFGLLLEPVVKGKFEYIQLNTPVRMGILMRNDSPFATYSSITPEILMQLPLFFFSRNEYYSVLSHWLNAPVSKLKIIGSCNHSPTAELLVQNGIGNVLTFENLYSKSSDGICFLPLSPEIEISQIFAWRKYTPLSEAGKLFLEYFKMTAENECQSLTSDKKGI